MKHVRIFLLLPVLAAIFTPVAKSAAQTQSSQVQSTQPSLAEAVDREISAVEKLSLIHI